MRVITGLALAFFVLAMLALQNVWLFASIICLVCIYAQYEWIKNKFQKTLLGFLLIFNFGFWSIFLLLSGTSFSFMYPSTPYFTYGSIIFNTALFDTFAYMIGSKYGKTYIVKKISPNKTLEGLIGGLLASLFFSIFLIYVAEAHYWIVVYFLLGSLSAFFGDLLISYFKRKSGTKDTGNILPGHGGVLDRIDSHLIATPLLIILVLFS